MTSWKTGIASRLSASLVLSTAKSTSFQFGTGHQHCLPQQRSQPDHRNLPSTDPDDPNLYAYDIAQVDGNGSLNALFNLSGMQLRAAQTLTTEGNFSIRVEVSDDENAAPKASPFWQSIHYGMMMERWATRLNSSRHNPITR